MVAGIIVAAVADELLITHPLEAADAGTVAVTLGGPALFLAGHGLFTWATFGIVAMTRLVAIGALVALTPLALTLPTLAVGAAATIVVLAVATVESFGPAAADEDDEIDLPVTPAA